MTLTRRPGGCGRAAEIRTAGPAWSDAGGDATTIAQHLAAVDAKATALEEGERDRLVTQLQRDAETLATLARTAEAAEGRVAAPRRSAGRAAPSDHPNAG